MDNTAVCLFSSFVKYSYNLVILLKWLNNGSVFCEELKMDADKEMRMELVTI